MKSYKIIILTSISFLFVFLFLPSNAQAGCCQCLPGILNSRGEEIKECFGNQNFSDHDICSIFCENYIPNYTPPSGYPIFSNFCEENTNCPLDKKSCCIKINTRDEKIESCTSNITQEQCNVPFTKYIDGKTCEEINCSQGIGQVLSSFLSTEYKPPVKKKEIKFVPQVTIPGSVEFGGKVFTINKGQGIIVDGELLSKYIALLFNWLIGVIGVIAVAYMAFGGMQWLAAAGSAEGINKAKETIRDSFIGLLLVVSSYTALNFINPNLVGFNPLKIDEIEGIILIGSDAYEKITGTKLPKPFDEDMKTAMRQVSQANNVHYCVLATILTKESGGKVDAIGHDENVRKKNIKSREDFVDRGCLMYSGKRSTAVCSITGAAQNDDNVAKNRADLGLDRRYSHGIGVGQITIFSNGPSCNGASHCRKIGDKLYDPKSLLKLDVNLEAIVKLWKEKCPNKVTQECFRKYNGDGEVAEAYGRDAWSIYNNCLAQNP